MQDPTLIIATRERPGEQPAAEPLLVEWNYGEISFRLDDGEILKVERGELLGAVLTREQMRAVWAPVLDDAA